MTGRYARDRVPTWDDYARQAGMHLRGAGTQRRARCGIHGGTRDSLCVHVAGPWQCHACGASGSDVLDYHRALHELRFVAAARELGAWDDGADIGRPRAAPPRAPARPAVAQDDDAGVRRREARIRQGAEIYASGQAIGTDDIAARYLLGRACTLPDPDGELRWLPRLELWGFDGPALVGRMTTATDHREVRGAHITWLRPDGRDGWRRHERRYVGPKSGCVVRLDADDAATTGLAIAEGIETALALRHGYRPTWAALDAGNLAALPVLSGIEALTIAQDHDTAGIRAAEACANRWTAAGRDVYVIRADRAGADIADIAAEVVA